MSNDPCLDGERLCARRRAKQDRRDEQEYLEKHNPRRVTLMEVALLLLVAVLAFDAVRSGFSRSGAPGPHTVMPAATADERGHSDDWQSFGYDVDLRR